MNLLTFSIYVGSYFLIPHILSIIKFSKLENENKALYKTQNFNIESTLVQTEFRTLLEKFKSELIKKC